MFMDLLDNADAIYAVYAQEYLWHPVELYIILSSAPEEVLHAIKVEAQGEAHGLVQGVALCCGYAVCGESIITGAPCKPLLSINKFTL